MGVFAQVKPDDDDDGGGRRVRHDATCTETRCQALFM